MFRQILKTMRIIINLNEQQLERLMSGKRIPGSLFAQRTSNEQFKVDFYEYGTGKAKRPREQTLMRMDHGTVRKTRRNYKLIVSLPDDLGEARCGQLMLKGGKEANDFMMNLSKMLNA